MDIPGSRRGESFAVARNSFSAGSTGLIVLGLALHLAFGVLYLYLGQANGDEAWYLIAAHRVLEGALPYRDFAFTQMPLTPYLQGVIQAASPGGLYVGRAVSVLCSMGGHLAAIALAYRLAGRHAASLTSLLIGTFTHGIYFTTIIKTYAPLFLLFSLTGLALHSPRPQLWSKALAVTLAFLAAMTRLSALPLFIAVAAFTLASARRRAAHVASLAGLILALILLAAAFIVTCPEAARWNLITHHMSQWNNASIQARLDTIFFGRLPHLLLSFAPHSFLFGILGIIFLQDAERRSGLLAAARSRPGQSAVALGVAMHGLSHLGTGGWHLEYLIPAAMTSLVFAGALASRALSEPLPSFGRRALQVALLLVLVAEPARHLVTHLDVTGGKPPIEEIREVSAVVSARSTPNDSLFVLEASWVAIESRRAVLPGMTLAQFSLQNMSSEESSRLKLIGPESAVQFLRTRRASVVVLTDLDWRLFDSLGCQSSVRAALSNGYVKVYERAAFGQRSGDVAIYSRAP